MGLPGCEIQNPSHKKIKQQSFSQRKLHILLIDIYKIILFKVKRKLEMVKWPISDSKTPLYLIFQVPMKPKKVVPEAKVPAPKREVAATVRGTSYYLF